MFTCIGSMKAWDLQQCRSFHYNHHPYTDTTEETEKERYLQKKTIECWKKGYFLTQLLLEMKRGNNIMDLNENNAN